MPRKPKTISKDKIPSITASLKAKAKTPITVTLEALVLTLASPIQEMLDAGYSYDDVSAVFASHGVELAASGIKNYHLKSQRTQPLSSPAPLADQPSPDQPEPEQQSSPEALQQSDSSSSKEVSTAKKSSASAKSKFNVTDRSLI